jgi:hypothetical protein
MRNELNNVTNKLFKTDLSIQKVELALGMTVDDIKKSYENIGAEDNSGKGMADAKAAILSFSNSAKSIQIRAEKFLKDWELFQANVKGLGLEVPSNVKDLGNFAKGDLAKSKALFKAADAIQKAINL